MLSLFGARAVAQPAPEAATLRGESQQTRKRLAEADQKILAGKTAEAIEELQRILDEASDDLISLRGGVHRPARWVAFQLLAKLPAEALKPYRDRIDAPARKLLEAGQRNHDPRPLWKLLDRYFLSRPGEEASLLLGDLLFERGEFRAAKTVWGRLLPDAGAEIVYPGPKTEPASIRARMILATLFAGERELAEKAFKEFKKKYPGAAGQFAGRKGKYAETLQALLERPLPPAVSVNDREWPTFGGGPGRAGRIHGPIPFHWPTRPTWTIAIPPVRREVGPGPAAPADPPFGHPVIHGGIIYISDGDRVLSFDLANGRSHQIYPPFPVFVANRNPDDPRASPTLTVSQGRLFARIGAPVLHPPAPSRPGSKEETWIICFAPVKDPGRNSPPMRVQWQMKPPQQEGRSPGVWEGAPLAANGRLYAAFARFENGRIVHSVACYDPADADTAPAKPAWIVEVCDSSLAVEGSSSGRTRHELLTLAGRNVVFCSNTGAVVALDAREGRRAWAFQYPRAAHLQFDANRSARPAPAVSSGGRVFIAPADAGHVWALDAETGKELWESGATEGASILGVSRHRVIVEAAGPVRGIRGLNAANGSYREVGWIQTTNLLGYGHGAASDDAIVWPTRKGLYLLDPETGTPLVDPIGADSPFGHVAVGNGWLVVVTPKLVKAYRADGPPSVRPRAPRKQFEIAVEEAERNLAAGQVEAARIGFARLVREDLPASLRAWAAARKLQLGQAASDAQTTPRELLGEWLISADGKLRTLGMLVDRKSGKAGAELSLPGKRKPCLPTRLTPTSGLASIVPISEGSIPLKPIPGAVSFRHAFVGLPGGGIGSITLENELWDGIPFHAELARNAELTHAADLPGGFVAAGPSVVMVFRDAETRPWVFRVPWNHPLSRTPSRRTFFVEPPFPRPTLSSFELAGDWLFARLGEHHLIAFDLSTRQVAWVLGTHARLRYEPHQFPTEARFEPRYFVSERLLVVQLSDGRRWMVQARTGRIWNESGSTFPGEVPRGHGIRTAPTPWRLPPVELGGAILAIPDGPGLIQFVDRRTGQPKFRYQTGGETSLEGSAIQLRRWNGFLIGAVRRNYGVELDRIDPHSGKSAWPGGSVFLDVGDLDLASADADPDRIYLPQGGKLLAIRLEDGKIAWEAKLPLPGKWAVKSGPKSVIAYPTEAIPSEPIRVLWKRLFRSFHKSPQPWRLPWLATTLYHVWIERTVAIVMFDPETGKELKSLRVAARGPIVSTWFEGGDAAVATGERVYRFK